MKDILHYCNAKLQDFHENCILKQDDRERTAGNMPGVFPVTDKYVYNVKKHT